MLSLDSDFDDTSKDLTPNMSITAFVQQRQDIKDKLLQIKVLIEDIKGITNTIDDPDMYKSDSRIAYLADLQLGDGRQSLTRKGSIEYVMKDVDANLWDLLLKRSGVYSFMDKEARGKWAKDIKEHNTPELTPENIKSTFQHLYSTRKEMFVNGVVNVFKQLSWDYKTNNPCYFGKRIVMRGVVSYWGFERGVDQLDDLRRVMCILDGNPEPDHTQGMRSLLHKIQVYGQPQRIQMRIGPQSEIADDDTPYFSIKTFKNGNAHVTFERLDLVERMNKIVASKFKNALPPDDNRETSHRYW